VTVTAELNVWELLEQQFQAECILRWGPAKTPVLAVDSEKGGVGKSSLVTGLAAVAAAGGLRVLVIDLDPRASATAELGIVGPGPTVNDLLYVDPDAEPEDLPELLGLAAEAIRPAGEAWGPNVFVLAAVRGLSHRETDTRGDVQNRLRVALEGVVDKFDLVLIDLPPRAGGILVGAGLNAATHVIFPGTLDEDGLVGIKDAYRTFRITRQTMAPRELHNLGVLRTIVAPRTKLAQHYDDQFREEFGADLLDVAVPRRIIRQEARGACVPITVAADKPDAQHLITSFTHVLNVLGRAA
jgi:chromosome partitioning protein